MDRRLQVCDEGYARAGARCTRCGGSAQAGLGGAATVALLALGVPLLLRARRQRRTLPAAALGELSEQINPMSAAVGAAAEVWETVWEDGDAPAAAPARRRARKHWALVQAAVQPVRILVGFAQIVGQLGQVLCGGARLCITRISRFRGAFC